LFQSRSRTSDPSAVAFMLVTAREGERVSKMFRCPSAPHVASRPGWLGEKAALKIWEGCAGIVRRDVARGVVHWGERRGEGGKERR
jgi:hypothetical protein